MGYKTYSCAVERRCGGCELLAVPYPIQLRRKLETLTELFGDLIEADAIQIHPMENPVAYRHKAATPFAPGRKGRVLSGFYAKGTHRIIACNDCLVEAEGCREALNACARIATSLRISAYNEDSGRGLLRHAIVRSGWKTNEALLTVVANGEQLAREEAFVQRLVAEAPLISAVALNTNTKKTNAMLGRKSRALFGGGVMHDKLLGCTFEIGPTSFYQTNPEQTELLYRLALEPLEAAGGERLLDAYCGLGTIGLCAAHKTSGLEVVGVEKGAEAVRRARTNARANGLEQACRFVEDDATAFMRTAARRRDRFDLIVLDPPRAGTTPQFIEAALALRPQAIAYISCNPVTQRRDLDAFLVGGYRLTSLSGVDMFPHTKHIESVALLSR